MSDAQKPVEETPVAVPAAAPATDAPAATETPATEAPKETPAAAEATEAAPAEETKKDDTEQPKEEAKEEAKEVTPASEGVLGYKAPGLVKGLRFSKRFFYFSEEAVEAKQLATYQQNEKPAVAHPTVAWATQTGKGLLFIVKRAEDKATPAGILNLAEISDVSKESATEFLFKINGQKHTFQAANAAERDSWIAAVEAASAAAKAEKETLVASEGYKAQLEKLTKPAVAVPAKKPVEAKEEPKEEEAKEEAKKEEATPAAAEETKETKEKAKSRSQSRKRASIFGISLGKKEETEEKKEEKKEEKAEEKTEEAKPAEAATETPAEASTTAEAASPAPAETAETKEEDKKEAEEKKEETAEKKDTKEEKKAKRASIFGNFFQKVTSPSAEKSEKEATAPAAETPAVSSTAPQLDHPVEGEAAKPIEPESVTAPAAPAAEAEAPKEAAPATSPATETPGTKEKRRTSFFGNFGKKKGDSDNEGTDGESKPKAKLGGLFRKPSKAVKSEPKEDAAEEAKTDKAEAPKEATVEESPAEEAAKPAEAATNGEESKPVNVASTSTPVQAAA